MTQTLGDAPDWQGYSQWRASEGTAINQFVTVADPYIENVVVTNWASFNLYIVLDSGIGITVAVIWYNDAAYSEVADTQEWVLNAGNILNVTLPCLSPYAQLKILTAESGNQIVTGYFTPQNLAVTKATYLTENNVLLKNGITLAESASDSYAVPYVVVGPAAVTLTPYDDSGLLLVAVFPSGEDADQATTIYQAYAPTAAGESLNGSFVTPAYPVTVKVTNTDEAASHEFNLYYQGLSQ